MNSEFNSNSVTGKMFEAAELEMISHHTGTDIMEHLLLQEVNVCC